MFFVLKAFLYLVPGKEAISLLYMKEILKILIVDDEPEARDLLKYMLQEQEGVEVVAMAGNVDEALILLNREHPDIVFLDIQMPEKDGFQFIEKISHSGSDPGIIFVTAFDNYAIKAIRNSVFDYILKPVQKRELIHSIERFRAKNSGPHPDDLSRLIEALKRNSSVRIKFNTRSGYILIDPLEVVYCEADGNYTHIQLINGNKELTTQNLGSIEELLSECSFFRVSRSYLVNLKFLVRVERKSASCTLEYSGGSYTIKIPQQKIKMLESSFD